MATNDTIRAGEAWVHENRNYKFPKQTAESKARLKAWWAIGAKCIGDDLRQEWAAVTDIPYPNDEEHPGRIFSLDKVAHHLSRFGMSIDALLARKFTPRQIWPILLGKLRMDRTVAKPGNLRKMPTVPEASERLYDIIHAHVGPMKLPDLRTQFDGDAKTVRKYLKPLIQGGLVKHIDPRGGWCVVK
jgi:hypothetical protein